MAGSTDTNTQELKVTGLDTGVTYDFIVRSTIDTGPDKVTGEPALGSGTTGIVV